MGLNAGGYDYTPLALMTLSSAFAKAQSAQKQEAQKGSLDWYNAQSDRNVKDAQADYYSGRNQTAESVADTKAKAQQYSAMIRGVLPAQIRAQVDKEVWAGRDAVGAFRAAGGGDWLATQPDSTKQTVGQWLMGTMSPMAQTFSGTPGQGQPWPSSDENAPAATVFPGPGGSAPSSAGGQGGASGGAGSPQAGGGNSLPPYLAKMTLQDSLKGIPAGAPTGFTPSGAGYSPAPGNTGPGVVKPSSPGKPVTFSDYAAAYNAATGDPSTGGAPPAPGSGAPPRGGLADYATGGNAGPGAAPAGGFQFNPSAKTQLGNSKAASTAVERLYSNLGKGMTAPQAQAEADNIEQQFGVKVALPMRPRDFGRPVGSTEYNNLQALLSDPNQTGAYSDKYGALDLEKARAMPGQVLDNTPNAITQARQTTAQAYSKLAGTRGDYIAGPQTDNTNSRTDLNDTENAYIKGPKTDEANARTRWDNIRANTTATGVPQADRIIAQRAKVLGQIEPLIKGKTVVDGYGTEHHIPALLTIDANGNLAATNPSDPQSMSALQLASPLWNQQRALNNQAAIALRQGGSGNGGGGNVQPAPVGVGSSFDLGGGFSVKRIK